MVRCSIIGCKSDNAKNLGTSFHGFPYDPDMRKKWISAIGRKDWVPGKHSKICSEHFEDKHFIRKLGKKGSYTSLYPEAMPVKNMRGESSRKPSTPKAQANTHVDKQQTATISKRSWAFKFRREQVELCESEVCRGCLSLTSKLEKFNEHTKRIYSYITGITVIEDDGYPSCLCVECMALMRKVLMARRKMRRAFFAMKEVMLKKNKLTHAALAAVDRQRTNLESPIGYWRPLATSFYNIRDAELETDKLKAENIISIDRNVVLPVNRAVAPVNNAVSPLTIKVSPLTDVVPTVGRITKKSNMLEAYMPECDDHIRHVIEIKPDKEVCFNKGEGLFEDEPVVDDGEFIEEDLNVEKEEWLEDEPVVDFEGSIEDETDVEQEELKKDASILEQEELKDDEPVVEQEELKDDEPVVEDCEEDKVADDPQEPAEEINENINLTNVFENYIEDDDCGSDYSMPDEFPMESETSNEKREETLTKEWQMERRDVAKKEEPIECNTKKSQDTIKHISETLATCDVEVCSMEQQLRIFETRKKLVPYATATYKCGICLTVYNDLGELQEHVTKHNSMMEYPLSCAICCLKSPTEELLELHVSENHKYLYRCRQCDGRELYTLQEVMEHGGLHKPKPKRSAVEYAVPGFKRFTQSQEQMNLKMAHRSSRFECPTCHMRFHKQYLMHIHAKRHADFSGSVICDICLTWQKSLSALAGHIRLYHLYRYECQHCPEVFFNKLEAQHHQSQEKHEQLNDVQCEHCGKMLHRRGIKPHIYKRHRASALVHECVACGRGYEAQASLYTHQLAAHGMLYVNDPTAGEEAALCKACDIQFLSVTAYRQHAARKKHEDAQFFENTCSKCFKLFETEEAYNQHMEWHSGPKYPRECSYCGRVYRTPTAFFTHQWRRHPDEAREYTAKPRLCELCGELVFHWYTHMNRHKEGLARLSCDLCRPARAFKEPLKLVRHTLNTHTPLPHACSLCGDRFGGRQECLDHILKLHAPERVFKCTSCSRSFSHRDFLIEHAKKAHGVTMKRKSQYNCTIKNNIVVYPHMKINMSLVKPEVLKILKIKLLNYDNTQRKALDDYKDYVITDEVDNILDESEPRKRKIKWSLDGLENEDGEPAKRRAKRTKTEPGLTVNVKKRRIKSKKVEEDTRESDENEILNTYVINGRRLRQEVVEEEVVNDNEVHEEAKQDTSNGDLIVEDEELQVFEENGEKYVLLNGLVYKIETI